MYPTPKLVQLQVQIGENGASITAQGNAGSRDRPIRDNNGLGNVAELLIRKIFTL